ncbi:MAG: hypothetical protein HYU97_03165 [Deltaproteobacteria bacterium]|nr:hypothetical protein [Deltaproteobacteria bacterium]
MGEAIWYSRTSYEGGRGEVAYAVSHRGEMSHQEYIQRLTEGALGIAAPAFAVASIALPLKFKIPGSFMPPPLAELVGVGPTPLVATTTSIPLLRPGISLISIVTPDGIGGRGDTAQTIAETDRKIEQLKEEKRRLLDDSDDFAANGDEDTANRLKLRIDAIDQALEELYAQSAYAVHGHDKKSPTPHDDPQALRKKMKERLEATREELARRLHAAGAKMEKLWETHPAEEGPLAIFEDEIQPIKDELESIRQRLEALSRQDAIETAPAPVKEGTGNPSTHNKTGGKLERLQEAYYDAIKANGHKTAERLQREIEALKAQI